MAGPIIDITPQVKYYQLTAPLCPVEQKPIPTQALTGILAASLDPNRGIGGLKFTVHLEETQGA